MHFTLPSNLKSIYAFVKLLSHSTHDVHLHRLQLDSLFTVDKAKLTPRGSMIVSGEIGKCPSLNFQYSVSGGNSKMESFPGHLTFQKGTSGVHLFCNV